MTSLVPVGAAVAVAIGTTSLLRSPARVPARSPVATPPVPARRTPATTTIIAAVAAGTSVAAALLGPAVVVIATSSLLLGRHGGRLRRARRARRTLEASLPDLLERLVLLVDAGLPPVIACRELAADHSSVSSPAMAEVVRRVDRGERLADALGALPEHLGPAARSAVDALSLAERHGLPLAPVLVELGTQARRHRRRLHEAHARRLPIRLSVPLVVCTLPGFVLVAIVPVALGTVSSLRGLSV